MECRPVLARDPSEETPGDAMASLVVCDLCGARFSAARLECGRCPFSAGCRIVRCPHCGYSFPRGSRMLEALRRILESRRGAKAVNPPESRAAESGESLATVPVGGEGRIVRVVSSNPRRLIRLANLGIVAGSLIRVEQQRPAAVVRIAETFLALDPAIAAEIYVRRS